MDLVADLVAGKQTSRKLPTQGSSDLSALLWNGMGMGENGTACRALIFGRKRGGREREIREAKKFYWFILMSWE